MEMGLKVEAPVVKLHCGWWAGGGLGMEMGLKVEAPVVKLHCGWAAGGLGMEMGLKVEAPVVKMHCGWWAGGEIGMEMGLKFDEIWAGTGRAGLESELELKRDGIGWGRSWIRWLVQRIGGAGACSWQGSASVHLHWALAPGTAVNCGLSGQRLKMCDMMR